MTDILRDFGDMTRMNEPESFSRNAEGVRGPAQAFGVAAKHKPP
jgi:hypothetical protein